jgi:hypothetical protein
MSAEGAGINLGNTGLTNWQEYGDARGAEYLERHPDAAAQAVARLAVRESAQVSI